MKTIRTISHMQQIVKNNQHKTIGFVPTMGYLHEGHLSLAREARKENDLVIMSIFVNPLQFGPTEDFAQYPRNEAQDQKVAEEVGVDILFIPNVNEMYPETMDIDMIIHKGTDVLCGQSRPGHFNGVATVLTKLFHIVQPQRTYFGLKDAQQFAIVNTLITQLNFPIELIGLPTVREEDGLAKSSRNVYLSKTERKEAIILYQSLQLGKNLIRDRITDVQTIRREIKNYIQANTNGEIDYVELLSYPDLKQVEKVNKQIIIAIAVYYDQARLIDNIILDSEGIEIEKIIK